MKLSLTFSVMFIFFVSANMQEEPSTTTPPFSTTPLTTTLSSIPETTTENVRREMLRAQNKARRVLSNEYQSMYYKMCSETFYRMKGIADECSQELNMATDGIQECVRRRMSKRTGGKKKNNKRGRESVPEVLVLEKEETTTSEATTMAPALVISDEISSTTTEMSNEIKITNSTNSEETSWRTIWRLESHTVSCYISSMRRSNEEYKKMPKQEWRDLKAKLTLENLTAKKKCLAQKASM